MTQAMPANLHAGLRLDRKIQPTMNIRTIHSVYFSATYTTCKVVREIARVIGCETVEHDVTCALPPAGTLVEGDGQLLIAAAPVYAGRIPRRMAEALRMFRANGVPAIVVCVYGNRDYDDALVELQDCVESQGFKAVAAAAFIGRHCIFPAVATDRPDDADMQKAGGFARRCASLLAAATDADSLPALKVKGNRPYKQGGASTFSPTGDASLCTKCLTCVRLCPASAISEAAPCATDASKCMACGRCVVVCPHGTRMFRGDAYAAFGTKFVAAFSARKEPETFFAEG